MSRSLSPVRVLPLLCLIASGRLILIGCSSGETGKSTTAASSTSGSGGATTGAGTTTGSGGMGGGLSDAVMAALKTLSPLPAIPPDTTNKYADNAQAAALGQKLFFDTWYSGPIGDIGATIGHLGNLGDTGKASCNTCHSAASWFIDARPGTNSELSAGATSIQAHNTPSLVNDVFYTWYNWNGGRDTLWVAGTAPGSLNGSLLTLAHRVYDAYRDEYNMIFTPPLDPALDANAPDAARFPRPQAIVPAGKPPGTAPVMQGSPSDATWAMMTMTDQETVLTIVANFAKAIGAYERLLVSRNAPFDRFVAGDANAISALAKQGAALFVGKGSCIACHSGPLFSDDHFHNLGEGPSTDLGRFGAIPNLSKNQFNGGGSFSDDPVAGQAKLSGLTQSPTDVGAFRTATLRNIAQTAPYLHTGRLSTLVDVIEFYNAGGGTITPPPSVDGGPPPPMKDPLLKPLNLTTEEKAALVEFLSTLTGDPIPAALTTDTSAPPPQPQDAGMADGG
jgi:cytochrome c peroxidase